MNIGTNIGYYTSINSTLRVNQAYGESAKVLLVPQVKRRVDAGWTGRRENVTCYQGRRVLRVVGYTNSKSMSTMAMVLPEIQQKTRMIPTTLMVPLFPDRGTVKDVVKYVVKVSVNNLRRMEESSVLPQEETSPWVTKIRELFLGHLLSEEEEEEEEEEDKICENYNRGGPWILRRASSYRRFIIEHARL